MSESRNIIKFFAGLLQFVLVNFLLNFTVQAFEATEIERMTKAGVDLKYATTIQKYFKEVTVPEIIELKKVQADLYGVMSIKFSSPTTTIAEIIEMKIAGVKLDKMGIFRGSFPEASLAELLEMDRVKVDFKGAAIVKHAFPDVTTAEIIAMTKAKVNLSRAVQFTKEKKRWADDLQHIVDFDQLACQESNDIGVMALLQLANYYLSTCPELSKKKLELDATLTDPVQAISKLLDSKEHDTIVIGEVHSDVSSKKVLMELMDKLKEKNAVLALEHLLYSKHQKLLDQYINGDSDQMPKELEEYLAQLDEGHGFRNFVGKFGKITSKLWEKYNFSAIVKQAKKSGVAILAIDTVASYHAGLGSFGSQGKDRYAALNYVSKIIMDKSRKKGQKIVVLTGSAHNNTRLGVLGICELNNAPSIVISDDREGTEFETKVKTNIDKGDEGIKADLQFIIPIIPR